ncbi:MAG TPA: hypothetical protein DEH78_03330 [Solibacterales bacterium]|nr:hypothetical protein [Bryobacterales bacterium]
MDLFPVLKRIVAAAGYTGNLDSWLLLFGLVFARLATAINLAPFLGGQNVPAQVRVGLSAVIAVLLMPSLPAAQGVGPILALALLVKEALTGALIGFLAQIVFWGIEMAGALIDNQRGMNQISLYTPQLAGNTSLLGMLQVQAAVALLFTFDGHLYYVRALADSFQTIPATELPRFTAQGFGMAQFLLRATADLFVVALRLSAPVLLALFLVDVCFGVFNRVTAQVPIHSENQTVKAFVSLFVLVLVLPLLTGQLREYPQQLFSQIGALMASLR